MLLVPSKEYYENNKERLLEAQKIYKQKNKVKLEAKRKEWKEKNPDYGKNYYQTHKTEHRQYMKKWYQNNKKLQSQKARDKRLKNKILIFLHYSENNLCCKCCGEKQLEFLTLDHINGGGNKHRKILRRKDLYIWVIDNNFPEIFTLLCMNCNWAKGQLGYCPHQNEKKSNDYKELWKTLNNG